MLGIFAKTFMIASRTAERPPEQHQRWQPTSRAREEARLDRFLKVTRLF